MSRYIDADELLELYDIDLDDLGTDKPWTIPLEVVKQNIKDMPTADVEPVIRCDNCIYKDSCCRNMFTSFDDYPVDLEWCSAGEMDGEEE